MRRLFSLRFCLTTRIFLAQFAWSLLDDNSGNGTSWVEEENRRISSSTDLEDNKRTRTCLWHYYMGYRIYRHFHDAAIPQTL